MDSGNNSASLQSSSGGGCGGGDEEYDSRAAAANSFSSANFHTQNTSMFDPFANYFNPISRQQQPQPLTPSLNYPASLFNLDTDWSKTLRSDHNNSPHQFNNSPMSLLASSNKSLSSNSLSFGGGVSNFPSAAVEHGGGGGSVTITTTTTTTEPAAMAAAVPPADQPVTQPAVRNPKKRSRASRRAPTTVLTTDTTNFRAMVQEFTGIPAPPFTSSTYFHPRSRFDIFGATPNSSLRPPLNISQQPNYLRRPFPQKIQPQQPGSTPFLSPSSSSSSSSALLSCLANNIASASTTSAANNIPQSCNLFTNIQQNSILTSLLQSSQKYPFGSSNILGSKDQEQFQIPSSSNDSQLKMGSVVLEDYGMSNHNLGHNLSGLPNLISPEQAVTTRNQNSIIHGDKVQETVGSRGEGMVESWINSSH
ncbi:uncharacterized protein LOC107782827 [Nicotiana tabacum]|uniref:Nuclear pore complex protein DDB_G0274915-like n=1 Tax=Nicotiana tabacum TaxID=4097 RepID=A0A1S3Z4H3_TOBAC|nr:PREDICTED: nuclear pore complex protein DDB_G0274915-like [Nicotiana tabacum]